MAINSLYDLNQIIGVPGGSGRRERLITRGDYIDAVIFLQKQFYELSGLNVEEIKSKMVDFQTKINQLDNNRLKDYYSEIKSRCDELKAEKETAAQEKQEALFNEILKDYIFTIVPDLADNPDILVVNENMNDFVTNRQLYLSGLTNPEGLISPEIVGELSFEDQVEMQLLVDPNVMNPAALVARRQEKDYHLKDAITFLWANIYELQRKLGANYLPERSGSNDKLFAGFLRKLDEMDSIRLKKLRGILTNISDLKKSQLQVAIASEDVYNSLLGDLGPRHGGR